MYALMFSDYSYRSMPHYTLHIDVDTHPSENHQVVAMVVVMVMVVDSPQPVKTQHIKH
jgi:hypothetical protein